MSVRSARPCGRTQNILLPFGCINENACARARVGHSPQIEPEWPTDQTCAWQLSRVYDRTRTAICVIMRRQNPNAAQSIERIERTEHGERIRRTKMSVKRERDVLWAMGGGGYNVGRTTFSQGLVHKQRESREPGADNTAES